MKPESDTTIGDNDTNDVSKIYKSPRVIKSR